MPRLWRARVDLPSLRLMRGFTLEQVRHYISPRCVLVVVIWVFYAVEFMYDALLIIQLAVFK